MDELDVRILDILENDGRIPLKTLGNLVGVSDVTVKNRIEKLAESGIISRFTIDLNYEKIGLPLRVTIGLSVEPSMIDAVVTGLEKVEEYYLIWKTSGAHSINIRAAFRDHKHMNEVLDRSLNIAGIREYHLSILDRVIKYKRMVH